VCISLDTIARHRDMTHFFSTSESFNKWSDLAGFTSDSTENYDESMNNGFPCDGFIERSFRVGKENDTFVLSGLRVRTGSRLCYKNTYHFDGSISVAFPAIASNEECSRAREAVLTTITNGKTVPMVLLRYHDDSCSENRTNYYADVFVYKDPVYKHCIRVKSTKCTSGGQHAYSPTAVSNEIRSGIVKLRSSLSDEQSKVFDHSVNPGELVAVTAIAGSGKTKTIAASACAILSDPKVASVVCASFTGSAANTARKRIEDYLVDSGLASAGICFDGSLCRTIHSIALNANRIAGRPSKMVDSPVPYIREALNSVLKPHRLRIIGCDCYSDYWSHCCSFGDKLQKGAADVVIEKVGPTPKSEEELGEMLYETLNKTHDPSTEAVGFRQTYIPDLIDILVLIRKELLDRGIKPTSHTVSLDVINDANTRMERAGVVDHALSIRIFANSYEPVACTVLIVDEAQDLTQAQSQIILTTLKAGSFILISGDSSQGIFGFAGASPNPIKELMKMAKSCDISTHRYHLSTNYRSTREILEASELVLNTDDREDRGHPQALIHGPPVDLKIFKSESEELSSVSEDIVHRIKSLGCKPGEFAIIRYKNWPPASELSQVFWKSSIPFVITGQGGDVASPAIRLLSLVKMASGFEYFENGSEEPEDKAAVLQSAVRGVKGATMTNDCRDLVMEVMNEQQLTAYDAFFSISLLEKAKEKWPSVCGGKRDNLMRPILKRSTQSINVEKTQHLLKSAVSMIHKWLDDLDEDEDNLRDQRLVKVKAVGDNVHVENVTGSCNTDANGDWTSPISKLLQKIAREILNCGSNRADELKELLTRVDADFEEMEEFTLDGLVQIISKQSDLLEKKHEDESVILSTIHKFKGRERPVVYVTGMGWKFDYTRPCEKRMHAYDYLHNNDCDISGFECSCPRWKPVYRGLKRNAIVERQRLAHVALSRPKYELCVSCVTEENRSPGRTELALSNSV